MSTSEARDRAAARRRHPTGRWPHGPEELGRRIAALPALREAPHAGVALRVLAARGRAGLDPDGFAARLGVDVGEVVRAERGAMGWMELPEAIRRVA